MLLSESDVSDECETQFNEDQQLEQLINGQICFKIYPFENGMVKLLSRSNLVIQWRLHSTFILTNFYLLVAEIPVERKIRMPGSFHPLHDVQRLQCRFCKYHQHLSFWLGNYTQHIKYHKNVAEYLTFPPSFIFVEKK